ncbi:hypothetical protein H9Y04_01695 [Streptomyces sp. TRM66268-LWL]|uniref:Integral membrane protein n=1 Tax=Streptomyces polyasparticus TaxID=2767826 RepID=A0ABR7S8G9_9ACTN|nr:hypothetical protein [Streptomyces polyasparticus]MBC9711284.1 hypothetical protein [Streptomyces polyasparticus]
MSDTDLLEPTRTRTRTRDARRTPTPLRTECLRGFPPLAGLVVFCAMSLAMAAKSAEWMSSWGETRTLLHLAATLVCSPLTAAAGCWQGGREHRRRTLDLRATAARGAFAQFWPAALPVALWSVAGYALAAGAALLVNLPYAGGSGPVVGVLLADAVFLTVCALLGYVAGRLVRRRLAAPLVAIGGYAGLALTANSAPDGLLALSPAAGFTSESVLPVWWQPLAMTGWQAGLALAVVLLYGAVRRTAVLVPLSVAALCGALLVHGGPGMWRTDPVTRQQVCDTSTRPAICVNAMAGGLLPEVRAALLPMIERLEGVRNLPARFEDGPGEPGPEEAQLPMLRPLGWHARRGEISSPGLYRREAATALSQWDCPHEPKGDERAMRTKAAVDDWLAQDSTLLAREREEEQWAADRGDEEWLADIEADRAARRRLTDMSESERRAWLSEFFAARASCDPKDVPVL